jgi:hypothetical protein
MWLREELRKRDDGSFLSGGGNPSRGVRPEDQCRRPTMTSLSESAFSSDGCTLCSPDTLSLSHEHIYFSFWPKQASAGGTNDWDHFLVFVSAVHCIVFEIAHVVMPN